jgi:AcrR family transcriptional regulator
MATSAHVRGHRRGEESEAAIVEAARDLLAERGLAGLSMRGVARRVGVSATALYRYFQNKDALIARVVELGFQQFGSYLREAAASCPPGSLERVHALGEAYVRFALDHEAYFRVLFSIQRYSASALGEIPESAGYGLLRQAVLDAMEVGELRREDPDLVVLYLWSLAHGVVTIAFAHGIERCPEMQPGPSRWGTVELFRALAPLARDGIAAHHGAVERSTA